MNMWIFGFFFLVIFASLVMFFQIRKDKKEIKELQIKALNELGKMIKKGRETEGWTEENEELIKKEGIDIIIEASNKK